MLLTSNKEIKMHKIILSLFLVMVSLFSSCNYSTDQINNSGSLWYVYGNQSHSQIYANGSKKVTNHGGMLGGLGVWQANSHYDFYNRLVFHHSHVKLWPFYELKQYR